MNTTNPTLSELDLTFVFDATSSMSPHIETAKRSVIDMIEKIQASEKADVRFGLVAYRDLPPQDNTFITKVYPFTESTKTAKSNVDELTARGGGDTQEAVAEGLESALKLDWRKSATKICVLITDAPPHGLLGSERGSDGFPEGTSVDPIVVVNSMLDNQIIIYCVACEPQISALPFTIDFYKAICQLTGGQYILLKDSALLPDIIIGGAKEEMQLDKLNDILRETTHKVRAELPAATEEEVAAEVSNRMADVDVKVSTLEVTDVGEQVTEISSLIAQQPSLEFVRNQLIKLLPTVSFASPSAFGLASSSYSPSGPSYSPSGPSYSPSSPSYSPSSASYGGVLPGMPSPQRASSSCRGVSTHQVQKMMHRNKY